MYVNCNDYLDDFGVCYDLQAIKGLSSYEDARHEWVQVFSNNKRSQFLANFFEILYLHEKQMPRVEY